MSNKEPQKKSSTHELYQKVAVELRFDQRDDALWLMAIEQSQGDKTKVEGIYIKLRAEFLGSVERGEIIPPTFSSVRASPRYPDDKWSRRFNEIFIGVLVFIFILFVMLIFR